MSIFYPSIDKAVITSTGYFMFHRLPCVTGVVFPLQDCTYKMLLTFAAKSLLLHCDLIRVYQVQAVLSNGLTTWRPNFSKINLIRQERI